MASKGQLSVDTKHQYVKVEFMHHQGITLIVYPKRYERRDVCFCLGKHSFKTREGMSTPICWYILTVVSMLFFEKPLKGERATGLIMEIIKLIKELLKKN